MGFCDSDYSGDLDKKKILTGYLFTLFGSIISWKASLQHVVALSTTEVDEAVKEAPWLRGLIEELGIKQKQVVICCDSQNCHFPDEKPDVS